MELECLSRKQRHLLVRESSVQRWVTHLRNNNEEGTAKPTGKLWVKLYTEKCYFLPESVNLGEWVGPVLQGDLGHLPACLAPFK